MEELGRPAVQKGYPAPHSHASREPAGQLRTTNLETETQTPLVASGGIRA